MLKPGGKKSGGKLIVTDVHLPPFLNFLYRKYKNFSRYKVFFIHTTNLDLI